MKFLSSSALALTALLFHAVEPCTDILVTPGASDDGSAIIAYNADDVTLFGVLYHYPKTEGKQGEMIDVYEWDTGKYLGKIPQVNETYNVVGNGNEHGLVIGETTFGGVSVLACQPGAIIDYGSLIYLTLQRAKTAKEAIHVMDDLMSTYGYASGGESFSIADASGEVWLLEAIGRGDTYGRKGGVWVARRVPDGYITAHSNQARITTFPRDDPDNCLYSDDVVEVAIHYGLYPDDADEEDFSFSDVYDPVGFSSARFSEARTWSILSTVADQDGAFLRQYQDYAAGRDVTKRMPLFIKPYKKLSLMDVMNLMNSHYEGTELDGTKDVGGGIYGAPQRPRPLEWTFEGKKYHNERPVATYRTGWNFCARINPKMPPALAAVLWFAVDDSSTSPRVPIFTSSTEVAEPYAGKGTQDGVPGPVLDFDMKKAFWAQNLVANFCYSRWSDVYPVVRQRIDEIEQNYMEQMKRVEWGAQRLYDMSSPEEAIDYVTQFSVDTANALHSKWVAFFGELFVRFRDFHIITESEGETRCGCKAEQSGLSETMKRRIVMETGGHYEVTEANTKRNRLGSGLSGETGNGLLPDFANKSIY